MPVSLKEAKEFQLRNSRKLVLKSQLQDFRLTCGVDAAFSNNKVYGVACLFELDKSNPYIIEEASAVQDIKYPYVPGFLALREGAALVEAIKRLKKKPDVILVDGHGIAHPRGFGIASYVGFELQIPTIGCAKTKLVGEYEEPGIDRGLWAALVFNDKTVGAVLRTKRGVKPLFVSPGNLIDLESSIKVVLAVSRYRIPEPLRIANMKSKELRVASSR